MKNIFNLVRVYQERDISLRYLYLTLVIGFTGSILASFTSLPAPQILGAAFSIIVMSKFVIKNKLYIHQTVRNFAFIIIGGVIGYKLKADFFLELLNWKMSLMFLLVSIVVNIACVSFILKYFFKINVLHSVLLSVPGALSYAIAMSDEYEDKNDASTLIVVQILRVLAVTFIVPFFFVALSTDSSQATISAPSMGDNSFLDYGLILVIMLLAYPLGYFGKLVKIPCSYLLSGLFVIFFFHQFKVISNPIPTPFFFIGMSISWSFCWLYDECYKF